MYMCMLYRRRKIAQHRTAQHSTTSEGTAVNTDDVKVGSNRVRLFTETRVYSRSIRRAEPREQLQRWSTCEVSSAPHQPSATISTDTNHAHTAISEHRSQYHQEPPTSTYGIFAPSSSGLPPIDACSSDTLRSLIQRLPSTSSIIIPQGRSFYSKYPPPHSPGASALYYYHR
jgi:hypothetical protein